MESFAIIWKFNHYYSRSVNSSKIISLQLLDNVVSDILKVILDLYHHYLSGYYVYEFNLFCLWGYHNSVLMIAICSNELFFGWTKPTHNLDQVDYDYIKKNENI